MNKESCRFLGHPRLKSSDFISQSWKHRLTCLTINHRFINNIDSHSQSQHHKYGHRQSVYLDVLKLPPPPNPGKARGEKPVKISELNPNKFDLKHCYLSLQNGFPNTLWVGSIHLSCTSSQKEKCSWSRRSLKPQTKRSKKITFVEPLGSRP